MQLERREEKCGGKAEVMKLAGVIVYFILFFREKDEKSYGEIREQ